MPESLLQGARILVVDDLDVNRELLRYFLEQYGCLVEEAESGETAISLCEKKSFDLILMDIMMAGMDGREAAAKLKVLAGDEHIPIIYATALHTEKDQAKALAMGGDDFISKPISFPVLEAKLNAHLRVRALHRKIREQNKTLNSHNQRLARERALVKHIFRDAYRRNYINPDCIREYISPVSVFNGDLLLTDLGPGGRFYMLLGDFTGHGLVAAIGTLPVKQVFFKLSQKGIPLIEMASELNRHLHQLLPADIFCAAVLLQIDIHSGELGIWSGGMPDGYLVSRDGVQTQLLHSRHMPLGVLSEQEFDPAIELLKIPDAGRLYFQTDGLIETENGNGQAFGEERLLQLLTTSEQDCFRAVIEAIENHSPTGGRQDDIAFVEINTRDMERMLESASISPQSLPLGPIAPCRIQFELSAEEIRRFDIVSMVSNMLASQAALQGHRDLIHTILSELYNNALEHSILGLGTVDKTDHIAFLNYYRQRERLLADLADTSIRLECRLFQSDSGPRLEILISDNGKGFVEGSQMDVEETEGRGLSLLRGLCEELEVSPDGHTLRALYLI